MKPGLTSWKERKEKMRLSSSRMKLVLPYGDPWAIPGDWSANNLWSKLPESGKISKHSALSTIFLVDLSSKTEENKLNSKSYVSFLKKVLNRFAGKIILVHDGAPYHKSKETKQFMETQSRLEEVRLPSYSPEFNIIEHLWKKAKARTHNKYFPDFQSLKAHVQRVLRSLQKNISEVLVLCSSYEDMLGGSASQSRLIIGF